MSPELRIWLIEQYSNTAKFSDAEIYQKIRLYQGNKYKEGRWRARLSPSKQINLKQFLKHGAFPAAFEALFAISGLCPGFRISMTQEAIAMRCDDVSQVLCFLPNSSSRVDRNFYVISTTS
jgi:hypothetical protein